MPVIHGKRRRNNLRCFLCRQLVRVIDQIIVGVLDHIEQIVVKLQSADSEKHGAVRAFGISVALGILCQSIVKTCVIKHNSHLIKSIQYSLQGVFGSCDSIIIDDSDNKRDFGREADVVNCKSKRK